MQSSGHQEWSWCWGGRGRRSPGVGVQHEAVGRQGSARSASSKTAGLQAAAKELAAKPSWVFLPVLTRLPTRLSHPWCAESGERVGSAPCPTALARRCPMSASGRHSGRGRGPYGARCPWCTAHAARGARSLPTVHAHCPWCTLTARGARSLPTVHVRCPRCTLAAHGARCPEPRNPGPVAALTTGLVPPLDPAAAGSGIS